ncbi:MAG: vitamin K epoxide reductase family protein [Gemmatimonadota bacterium]
MLNRMAVALLALVGFLISAYMSAYRFGLLGTIMCGSGGCETVQNSPWAAFLGVPVPLIGLAGYGALFAAAIAGLQPRFDGDRRIAGILSAAAVIGVLFSAYLTYLEAAVIRAWCQWCIVSAVLAALIFLFTLPELRRLRSPS